MTTTLQNTENSALDAIVDEVLNAEGVEGINVEEVAQEVAEETGTTKEAKTRGKQPRVPHEDFVAYWNEAENTEQVSEHFGISRTACSAKATQLRSKGYELKKFPRGRKKGQVVSSSTPSKATLRVQVSALMKAVNELGGDADEVVASATEE